MNKKIRILIADDFSLLREDMIELINKQPDMEVVGEASSGREIVELAQKTEYDLILMDIEYDGIKFKYDDYACERFRRDLVDSLTNLQRTYAIRESMIKSLKDLHDW